MNTLRQAVQEYLTMRRSLGFKLRDAGKLLLAFVKFMEQRRASYVTTKLALAWAQHDTQAVRPLRRLHGQRLSCAPSRAIVVRPIHARRFRRRLVAVSPPASAPVPVLGQGDPKLIACGAFATCPRGSTAPDVPMPVRITERHGLAPRRSVQS